MSEEKDTAQAQLHSIDIRPGDRFRHYKGGEYEIITLAVKEDTLEPFVIYQNVENGDIWARTLQNWSESVKINGKPLPRFEKLPA